MTLLLGLLFGAGLVLIASPFLWPRSEEAPAVRHSVLRDRLVQAGLGGASPLLVAAVCGILAVGVAALVMALTGVGVLALAAGAVGASLPLVAISWRARTRRRATRVVWPDVVDQLVSAVRSGLALPDSVMTLASAGPLALRTPFTDFATTYRTTGNFGLALDELKQALADPVADRLIETLRMSREVGGTELTTVLRDLGAYLRQEAAIRAEVGARQSWVVNAARLGVAAPWIVLLMLATRPEAAAAYNSPGGAVLIVVGLVVTAVAYRVMLSIGRLPEEPRWFA